MSATFAGGALRLSALAARMFGWRPSDFWASTPAELAAILAGFGAQGSDALSRNDLNRMMEDDDHG